MNIKYFQNCSTAEEDITLSDFRVYVFFLVLGVPFFFPLLLCGKLPGPFQVGLSDTFAFFEPFLLEFSSAVKNGGSPFWSHLSSFGSPAFLPLGTGVSHPFHVFHFFLPDPLAFVLGWWARIALFGVFTFFYMIHLRIRAWLALYFTLGLTWGSFFLNYGYEIIGYVMCFFPMALYYSHKLCGRICLRDFFFLTIATSGMLLGGFPSVILYMLTFLAVYVLTFSTDVKKFFFTSLACLCGVMLLLPVIYETFIFYKTTCYSADQRNALFLFDPQASVGLNLLLPSVFGTVMDHAAAGQRDFFGSRLGFGVIGVPLILVFSIYCAGRRAISRASLFWLATLAICIMLYFNIFSIKKLITYVPWFNEHPLTRLQTLITFSGSVSAALLTERMLRLKLKKSVWMSCLVSAGMILWGGGGWWPY
jgi:hypothetical protein